MKYLLKTLDQCATRLEAILKKLKDGKKLGKRDQNNIEWCINEMRTKHRVLEDDLKPPKPKTIQDSLNWVSSQKKEGTFLAVLDAENHLIRTMYISEKILKTPPEHSVTMDEIDIKMKKIMLVIPTLDFSRAIPKKAKGFVTVTKEGETVKVVS